MVSGAYLDLYRKLSGRIPPGRLIHDEARRLAFGTDASFYRLIPQLVVKVENEADVAAVLEACRPAQLPVTFRAAGTSLSGQSISDSVLVQLSAEWSGIEIEEGAGRVTLDPAVIGSRANRALAAYGRKIGPDPASINSCMVGGIAANNSSGMCCGTAQNSYRTLDSMRALLASGAVLDTSSAAARAAFCEAHPEMVERIAGLAARTRANQTLADRIRRKYKMKNTTGYSLNALVDFEDPVEIIQHLMIGSEGTLGFISRITYETVPDWPAKASALLCFPDVRTACAATAVLRGCEVSAVEIMDRASLRSVEDKAGMPPFLKGLPEDVAALLVEVRGETTAELRARTARAMEALAGLRIVEQAPFTEDEVEIARLWNVRKGLFPSVGAVREMGTSVIIEDVAFPLDRLAEAAVELQGLFRKYGYHEAIIFGHALEGNLHFVFTQDFGSEREVARYRDFMDEVARMVVGRYDGALKAEHGTGRNMAPYVEMEWGAEAYSAMREIKDIFDPTGLLNPGVILNPDPEAHLKNLKPLPKAHPVVDKCIECGFCEVNCPSRNLTFTPRQRIVVWREISRLREAGGQPARLAQLLDEFSYAGEATCAADGLCSLACPVGINTGSLIKELRYESHSRFAQGAADWVADHMGATTGGLRAVLSVADMAHVVLGRKVMAGAAGAIRKLSGGRVPAWNPYLPKGADAVAAGPSNGSQDKVVYFPSCVARAMGVARGAPERDSLTTRTGRLLRKAGYEVVLPKRLGELCCGMAFASKGFKRQGERKLKELMAALAEASEGGRYPVLFDTSPCLERVREAFGPDAGMTIHEPAGFVQRYLAQRLNFKRRAGTVAVHVPCSSRKMALDGSVKAVAAMCAERVVVPDDVGCCGFAGDRGFHYPELTASALQDLKKAIPPGCDAGYSTSRACEIGLSLHAGMHYRSLLYLVDECTEPLERKS
ncbi:MAG TPA: FAD-binding and (Fe-S)-binding domain-containing protein [Bryobacteraceae bacterium]|nr:FAD-binding and (Fe-S)-binding domain-containing protein [Bryobacteraceae bacterium]